MRPVKGLWVRKKGIKANLGAKVESAAAPPGVWKVVLIGVAKDAPAQGDEAVGGRFHGLSSAIRTSNGAAVSRVGDWFERLRVAEEKRI